MTSCVAWLALGAPRANQAPWDEMSWEGVKIAGLALLLVVLTLAPACGAKDQPSSQLDSQVTTPLPTDTASELDPQTARKKGVMYGYPDMATVGTHQSIHGRPIIPYKLLATDSDGRCEKLTFSATGLPAGLEVTNLNNCTATVSGTLLAKPGRYVVTYQVTEEHGASDSSVAIFVVKRGHQ